MTTAKAFRSGSSRAVLLPKAFRFSTGEVVLREKRPSLDDVLDPLPPWPDDIMPQAIREPSD